MLNMLNCAEQYKCKKKQQKKQNKQTNKKKTKQ